MLVEIYLKQFDLKRKKLKFRRKWKCKMMIQIRQVNEISYSEIKSNIKYLPYSFSSLINKYYPTIK